MAEFLLEGNNVVIDSQYEEGRRPLHFAVLRNSPQMIELLLRNGAGISKTSFDKKTPLHFAALVDSAPLATLLIGAGASVFSKDRNGKKPVDLTNQNSAVKNVLISQEEAEINHAEQAVAVMTSPRTDPRLAGAGNMTKYLPEDVAKKILEALIGKNSGRG